jgi:hypothetical protein
MKIQIKAIDKDFELKYIVQTKTKKFSKWETIYETPHLQNAIDVADDLKKIDNYNNSKGKKSVSFIVYGVRQPFQTGGYYSSLSLFEDYPEPGDVNGNKWTGDLVGELKLKDLFGEKCIEPKKYKITIEQA